MCVAMGPLSSLLGKDFLVQPFIGGITHTFVGNSSFYALRKSNKLIGSPERVSVEWCYHLGLRKEGLLMCPPGKEFSNGPFPGCSIL